MIRKLIRYISSSMTPFFPPKSDFAMINIAYPIIDAAGDRLILKTWAIGPTAKKALRDWLSSHPGVKPEEVEHTIVSESKWRKSPRFEPLGERVEVEDTYLKSLQA